MWRHPPRGPAWRDWLAAAAMAGAILATVPVARDLQRAVNESLGENAFLVGVLAIVLAVGAGGMRVLGRSPAVVGRSQRLWFAGGLLAFLCAALLLRSNPVEAVHLVQYAALGFLLLRAHSHRTRDRSVYLLAALGGASFGVVDEALQWLTPTRVWDLRDLTINGFAAAAVQLVIARGVQPEWVRPRFEPAGLRRACRGAGVLLLLLAASCFATPPRVGWLAFHVPGLAGLADHPDVILEFGHRLDDPAIGTFRSRLSAEELRETDARRGPEAGAILRQYADEATYPIFLTRFTPARDPFLHEARVHLFRRDRYAATASERANEPKRARRDSTVVYREEQILRRYFGSSLEHSGLALSAERLAELEALQLPKRPYTSPVSKHLVTRIGEAHLVAGFALAGAALAVASWRLRRRAAAPSGD